MLRRSFRFSLRELGGIDFAILFGTTIQSSGVFEGAMRKFLAGMLVALFILVGVPSSSAQNRRLSPKARAALTAGAGAAIGAGVGAIVGGGKGAAVGALLGGGGATAGWLIKNDRSRRRLGKYGQPIATIGAGTALGAGVGALIGGAKGAAAGALLGGGGTTAGYLLSKRKGSDRYYRNYRHRYPRR
jgi:hypothetical protein